MWPPMAWESLIRSWGRRISAEASLQPKPRECASTCFLRKELFEMHHICMIQLTTYWKPLCQLPGLRLGGHRVERHLPGGPPPACLRAAQQRDRFPDGILKPSCAPPARRMLLAQVWMSRIHLCCGLRCWGHEAEETEWSVESHVAAEVSIISSQRRTATAMSTAVAANARGFHGSSCISCNVQCSICHNSFWRRAWRNAARLHKLASGSL